LLPAERHARLVAGLTDPALVPGYWTGERLIEQPLVAERAGVLVTAQIDLLVRDAAGWHLYDFKTGMASEHAASVAQVRLYAELVRPLLDAPLIDAWLVDVEQRRRIAV
jgi:ATP-dependent exoDNAse (exonuclease V) beta subunit